MFVYCRLTLDFNVSFDRPGSWIFSRRRGGGLQSEFPRTTTPTISHRTGLSKETNPVETGLVRFPTPSPALDLLERATYSRETQQADALALINSLRGSGLACRSRGTQLQYTGPAWRDTDTGDV
eukprot:1104263-Rhodomonas_salina.2